MPREIDGAEKMRKILVVHSSFLCALSSTCFENLRAKGSTIEVYLENQGGVLGVSGRDPSVDNLKVCIFGVDVRSACCRCEPRGLPPEKPVKRKSG